MAPRGPEREGGAHPGPQRGAGPPLSQLYTRFATQGNRVTAFGASTGLSLERAHQRSAGRLESGPGLKRSWPVRWQYFNPDHDVDPLPQAVAELRRQIHAAAALVFSTPEYAGALPGSLKNLLEWTIGDGEAGSIYRKPVAWINASPRGAADAHESLRKVLGYASATIVEPACVEIPVTAAMVDGDGCIADPVARQRIGSVFTALVAHLESAGDGDGVS